NYENRYILFGCFWINIRFFIFFFDQCIIEGVLILNAIIYCRVSTDKKAQETSLARQKQELTKLAQKYNRTIDECIEEQASGYDIDRDRILQLLDYFSPQQANCLLIQDETRLGHGNTKTALFHQLQKLNVSIHTIINEGELQLSESDSMLL